VICPSLLGSPSADASESIQTDGDSRLLLLLSWWWWWWCLLIIQSELAMHTVRVNDVEHSRPVPPPRMTATSLIDAVHQRPSSTSSLPAGHASSPQVLWRDDWRPVAPPGGLRWSMGGRVDGRSSDVNQFASRGTDDDVLRTDGAPTTNYGVPLLWAWTVVWDLDVFVNKLTSSRARIDHIAMMMYELVKL